MGSKYLKEKKIKEKVQTVCLLTCANTYAIQINWKAFKNTSVTPDIESSSKQQVYSC